MASSEKQCGDDGLPLSLYVLLFSVISVFIGISIFFGYRDYEQKQVKIRALCSMHEMMIARQQLDGYEVSEFNLNGVREFCPQSGLE